MVTLVIVSLYTQAVHTVERQRRTSDSEARTKVKAVEREEAGHSSSLSPKGRSHQRRSSTTTPPSKVEEKKQQQIPSSYCDPLSISVVTGQSTQSVLFFGKLSLMAAAWRPSNVKHRTVRKTQHNNNNSSNNNNNIKQRARLFYHNCC